MVDNLVGIDPSPEEADARVDGWLIGVASGVTPRRRSGKNIAADEWATTVTVAGRDGCWADADVAVVDAVAPSVGADGVGQNGHGCHLDDGRQRSWGANVGSSPAGNLAALPSVVASTWRCQANESSVGIGWNAGKTECCNIVGVSTIGWVTSMSDEGRESSEGAGSTIGDRTVTGSSEHGIRTRSASTAVSSSDRLGAANERGSTRVRVACPQRQIPRVVGNIAIGPTDHASFAAERWHNKTQQ